MMKKTKWWAVGTTATVMVIAGAAGGYYAFDKNRLYYEPAPMAIAASSIIQPESTEAVPLLDYAQLESKLSDPRLGKTSIQISDATTGKPVLQRNPDTALLPASSTKTLTTAAALLRLDLHDRIVTEVYQLDPETAVIIAAGDVWLNQESIDELAQQIKTNLPTVQQVLIDTSIWTAPKFLESWDERDVDGGYIAPMEPAMINGGRIGAATGDVPRSKTPALDVATAVAKAVGVEKAGETTFSPAADAKPIAATKSPTLSERLKLMMADSDNVMAEAIGRELSPSDPAGETLRILAEKFTVPPELKVLDNSGLSTDNRISAAFLEQLVFAAASGDENLSEMLITLPVAGGSGTLEPRYSDLAGKGYVRAKTGTLTGTTALVGTIAGESGHTYSFAIICNDAPVTEARAAMDELTSALRTLQ